MENIKKEFNFWRKVKQETYSLAHAPKNANKNVFKKISDIYKITSSILTKSSLVPLRQSLSTLS